MFYEIIKHAHSGLRWIVLLLIVFSILYAIVRFAGKKRFNALNRKLSLGVLITTHTQFILGLILYFISPKVIFSTTSFSNKMLRFFVIEHLFLMLIAVVLITIGHVAAKKADMDKRKLSRTFIYFGIGLILMLIGIPWPWQIIYSAGWF